MDRVRCPLVAGIIHGPLARLVTPGKQDVGRGATIVAGAVGALVGEAIAQLLELDGTTGSAVPADRVRSGWAVAGYIAIAKKPTA